MDLCGVDVGCVLVGAVLDTLSGDYLLLFVPMIDLFLFQNPLATETPAVATYLPGHYPLALTMDAAFTGTVDSESVVWSLGVLVLLTTLATAILLLAAFLLHLNGDRIRVRPSAYDPIPPEHHHKDGLDPPDLTPGAFPCSPDS